MTINKVISLEVVVDSSTAQMNNKELVCYRKVAVNILTTKNTINHYSPYRYLQFAAGAMA